ncbi:MAG TPA: hypothetical protein PLV53_11675, partial [Anaerolineaceae bacterium]|nr:hypothetical protein [Anaerolineaceae bacterium]
MITMTQPSLDLITQWARAAGAILLEGFGRDHTLTYKDRNNLQTEMDRRSEAFLLEQVRAVSVGAGLAVEALAPAAAPANRRRDEHAAGAPRPAPSPSAGQAARADPVDMCARAAMRLPLAHLGLVDREVSHAFLDGRAR